jgi:hypothetical protein
MHRTLRVVGTSFLGLCLAFQVSAEAASRTRANGPVVKLRTTETHSLSSRTPRVVIKTPIARLGKIKPAVAKIGGAPKVDHLGAINHPIVSRILKMLAPGPRATIAGSNPATSEGTYAKFPGTHAIVNGVELKDVAQGHLGDCYFAAALAAVAYTHPETITKNIVERPDGSLWVRMYHPKGDKYEKDTVKMDASVPSNGTRPSFAHGTDSTQMWPAYFQKAYAMDVSATRGRPASYQQIGKGGMPGDAIAALTGRPSQHYDVSADLGSQLFTVMQHAQAAKAPATAWTPHDLPEGGIVHGDHTYTILGVREENGKQLVKLRNPWGYSPGADGIFELDMPTFAKTFVGMDIGS